MEAAHQSGIVHRDLKPSNILLDRSDTAYLCDFGIARLAEATHHTLTVTGVAIGTPAYMSPEQSRGDTTLGTPSDLYSLGCLLHELLAGTVPFTGTGWQVLNQHLNDAPAPLSALRPGVPRELEQLVLELLDKNPDRRPTAADTRARLTQLHTALAAFADAPTAVPNPPPPTVVATTIDRATGGREHPARRRGRGRRHRRRHLRRTLAHHHTADRLDGRPRHSRWAAPRRPLPSRPAPVAAPRAAEDHHGLPADHPAPDRRHGARRPGQRPRPVGERPGHRSPRWPRPARLRQRRAPPGPPASSTPPSSCSPATTPACRGSPSLLSASCWGRPRHCSRRCSPRAAPPPALLGRLPLARSRTDTAPFPTPSSPGCPSAPTRRSDRAAIGVHLPAPLCARQRRHDRRYVRVRRSPGRTALVPRATDAATHASDTT
ncbi:serine/threonine-protein kinase [Streptomyces avermitilis]|uniref:serine/threonine-protein kinase n=1 Tax=Streptomyces avermitilis TaxID=33903 RepID=UPI0033B7785C